MKTLHFEDYEDFAYAVSDSYDKVKYDDEYNLVDVIAKYEDAKEIIKELLCIGYDIKSIELGECDINNYDDEYIVSICENMIWCEPAKRDGEYIWIESDVVYIFDNCNSKIVQKIRSHEVYEVEINDCEDECDNCSYVNDTDDTCVNLSYDKNENTHGFTVSKSDINSYMSYSFYSSDELSHDEIRKMLKDFGF